MTRAKRGRTIYKSARCDVCPCSWLNRGPMQIPDESDEVRRMAQRHHVETGHDVRVEMQATLLYYRAAETRSDAQR